MPFRIHALRERVVVALLQRARGRVRTVCANERAACKTYASADRSALVAAKQAAGRSTDGRADDGAFHCLVVGRLLGRFTAHLRVRIAAALLLVEAELIEALAGAREDEDAGPARRGRRAGGEQQCSEAGGDFLHFGGVGGTRCHPLGHSLTYG